MASADTSASLHDQGAPGHGSMLCNFEVQLHLLHVRCMALIRTLIMVELLPSYVFE